MSFAVVGTDTGVGKTLVTAGLVGWLREAGVDARAVKPCQTGHPPDDDAGVVQAVCDDPAAATCLRHLEPPLAPAVAAAETDTSLDYDELLAGCVEALEAAAVGVVEGIGGLRVPLADGMEVLDLVADLDVPALVVARSGLGTLNHSALTVDALRSRGVRVHGVVLNEYEGANTAERTNPEVLAEMVEPPVWTLPSVPDPPEGAVGAVREHLPAAAAPGADRWLRGV